ncbi:MAG: hypothetical protein M0Z66_01420 [Thermaerobacter sp.]|nr:hypothetical protein [Thermaerobacter sp.]
MELSSPAPTGALLDTKTWTQYQLPRGAVKVFGSTLVWSGGGTLNWGTLR